MPQFDPSTFTSQLFWLLITFSFLYLIVSKFIIPKIGNILEMREDVIAHDLDRAKELKIEAEKILQEYETSISDAFEKKRAEVKRAIDDSKKETEQKNQELNKEIENKISESERKISHAKDAAIQEINLIATDVTQKALSSLAKIDTDTNNIKSIVNDVLKEKT